MDKRNLLLISNSTMRGEAYLGWCKDMIADFCNRHNVKKVLFVPYAGVSLAEGGLTKSYDAYEAKVAKVYAEFGVKLTSVHQHLPSGTSTATHRPHAGHPPACLRRHALHGLECW